MDDQLDNYIESCRLCLQEMSIAKVEIDENIEQKFYEMTSVNLSVSDLLPSCICCDCYEVLLSYSDYRSKFVENQQRLELLLTNNEHNMIIEEDNGIVEYEEIEIPENDDMEHIIIDENVSMKVRYEQPEPDSQSDDDDEELKLEDIVKPEFLHYCMPKKAPEPVKKVIHIPRQLEKKRHKIEQIRQELEPIECQECHKSFTNPVLLQQHVNKTHKKFICEFDHCSKIFTSQFQLDKHISTVHKNELHECQYCDKKFSQKLHLKNHLYTHSHVNERNVT